MPTPTPDPADPADREAPADRQALHAALCAAGMPDGHYFIEGVHEPTPLPVDFCFLRRSPATGEWETGIYERGTWHPDPPHPTEAAACQRLLRLLS